MSPVELRGAEMQQQVEGGDMGGGGEMEVTRDQARPGAEGLEEGTDVRGQTRKRQVTGSGSKEKKKQKQFHKRQVLPVLAQRGAVRETHPGDS